MGSRSSGIECGGSQSQAAAYHALWNEVAFHDTPSQLTFFQETPSQSAFFQETPFHETPSHVVCFQETPFQETPAQSPAPLPVTLEPSRNPRIEPEGEHAAEARAFLRERPAAESPATGGAAP